MATTEQLAEVRAATNEPSNTAPFTDDYVMALIDAYGMREAEYKIWVAKRNSAADLVQFSEGGSSRSQQQVFEHYSKIVAGYESGSDGSGNNQTRAPRTREITRG